MLYALLKISFEFNLLIIKTKNMKRILLFVFALTAAAFLQAQCTDLFFSEYFEGSGNNKGVEIYNPTQNPIDLSQYQIKRYSNGSFTETETMQLSGTLDPGDVVVITNGQTDSIWVSSGGGFWSVPIDPVLYALGDLHDASDYPAVCYFNGDDAITLETMNNVFVDIFGKIGEDPGGAWTNDPTAGYTDANGGKWLTRDYTLVRKPSVEQGITTNPSEFIALAEYDTLPRNFWDSLGFHTCVCNPTSSINNVEKKDFILIYPNPVLKQEFTVKASDIIYSVEIMNLLGQRVLFLNNPNYSGEMIVKLDDARNGIYLVKVHLQNQKFLLKKIIIK